MSQKPKLVVALLDEGQEFQRLQAEEARTKAVEAGLEAEILYAENSAIFQIQQLYKVIQSPERSRPRAILVETVAGGGLERVARAAARAGIGWVLLNRSVPYVSMLRQESRSIPVMVVSTDQLEVGRIQGRQMRALLPGGTHEVVYVQGPADTSAAQERLQGTRDVLQASGISLKVLDGQWTETSGEQALESWLRLKRADRAAIGAVCCQNDAMAVGARRALTSAGPPWAAVPLTGVDGLVHGGQRLVREGQLTATVVVPSATGPAVKILADALRTGANVPERVVLPPQSFPEVHALSNGER